MAAGPGAAAPPAGPHWRGHPLKSLWTPCCRSCWLARKTCAFIKRTTAPFNRKIDPSGDLEVFNPELFLSSARGILPRSVLLSWAGERSRAGSSCPSNRETQQETPLRAAVLGSSTRAGKRRMKGEVKGMYSKNPPEGMEGD